MNTTTWHNPTPYMQTVDIVVELSPDDYIRRTVIDDDGKPKTIIVKTRTDRLTWAPGETKAVPSRWNRAIHMIADCNHPNCHRGICQSTEPPGPKAKVVGGAAPLLQREGQQYAIDGSLVARPTPPRSVDIAPSDVAARLADDGDDPALQRARARRAAK